jgi:hypothetical protein
VKIMVTTIAAVLVTGALLAVRQASSASGADVPMLDTTAWQGRAPNGEQLLLRRDGEADRVLLLKPSGHEGVYAYDRATRTLTPLTEVEWRSAGGPTAECGRQAPPATQVLRIDPQSHRLMAGQREIAAAGSTVLAVTESPSHRFAAVLSQSAQPSLFPFLGAGSSARPRFHQIVSLPDAVVVGNAIRLTVGREDEVLAACWSADEQAVVYHDLLFAHLSVVEL